MDPLYALFYAAGKIGNTYPDRPSWGGGSEADCEVVQKIHKKSVLGGNSIHDGAACRTWIERLSKVATPVLAGMAKCWTDGSS